MEKICRNCTYFMYHRFAGFCAKKMVDTYNCFGNCEVCENYIQSTDEGHKALIDYEENVLKPFFKK